MTDASTTPAATPPRRTRVRRWGWRLLSFVVLAMVLGMADLLLTWWRFSPVIRALRSNPPGLTRSMQDAGRTGPPAWTTMAEIPGVLACAVMVSEDPQFHEYSGVHWRRIPLLIRRTFEDGPRPGTSGIAQQLARNLYLSSRFTPRRKVREWLLAINIDRQLTKDRQLELYLNIAQWGEGAWGVREGASALLGKPLEQISASDAILLTVALPAPERGTGYALHPGRRSRMHTIAQRLWDRGVLTDAEARAASARLVHWVGTTATTGSDSAGREATLALMGVEGPWRGPAMPGLGCVESAREMM